MLRQFVFVGVMWLYATHLAIGQSRVDVQNLNERMYVVVPMTGLGTYADPKRPLIAPSKDQLRSGTGIISWSYEPSDDGLLAIVEIVTRNRSTIDSLTKDARVLKSLEKGKHKRADVERELRVFKKSFSMAPPAVKRP